MSLLAFSVTPLAHAAPTLFVSHGASYPTPLDYQFANASAEPQLAFDFPSTGTWFALLRAEAANSSFSLHAVAEQACPNGCSGHGQVHLIVCLLFGLLFVVYCLVYCLFVYCLVYCLFVYCLVYYLFVYCLFVYCLVYCLFVYCLFIVCLLFVYCLFVFVVVWLLFCFSFVLMQKKKKKNDQYCVQCGKVTVRECTCDSGFFGPDCSVRLATLTNDTRSAAVTIDKGSSAFFAVQVSDASYVSFQIDVLSNAGDRARELRDYAADPLACDGELLELGGAPAPTAAPATAAPTPHRAPTPAPTPAPLLATAFVRAQVRPTQLTYDSATELRGNTTIEVTEPLEARYFVGIVAAAKVSSKRLLRAFGRSKRNV